MARAPGRERVAAQVDALCRSFLRRSRFLSWGWKLSLIVTPIWFYLAGGMSSSATPASPSPFWSSLFSGLLLTVCITLVAYGVSQSLGDWPARRAAKRLNRLYPIGRERDLALSLLQQRRHEVDAEQAAYMDGLLAELGHPPSVVEGAPVETQLAEALESLAAGREERSPAPWAEPEAEAPARPAGARPARRLRPGGVIPLQPEAADDRASRPPGRRPETSPREGTAR